MNSREKLIVEYTNNNSKISSRERMRSTFFVVVVDGTVSQ